MNTKIEARVEKPLVTIGIPTFNRCEYLKVSLESILAQSYKNIEVIISDNFSDDDTEKYCRKMAEYDSRIIYVKQPFNIGSVENFKYLLDNSNGTFFAWQADDDFCDSTYIQELVSCFEKDSSIVLCASDVKRVNSKGNLINTESLDRIYLSTGCKNTRKYFFEYPISNVFFAVYGLYKTEILKKVGSISPCSWTESLINSEVIFLAKVALMGKIVAIPKALKSYRMHEMSHYHSEARSISYMSFSLLKINISFSLIIIIFYSNVSFSEKFYLLGVVINSTVFTRFSQLIKKIVHVTLRKANIIVFKRGQT